MQKKSKNKRSKYSHFTVYDGDFSYQIPVSEITERLGIHPKTVYRWQKGTQTPDKNTLALIKILFIGVLPFPGWENFRMRHNGDYTYHNRPVYRLCRIGSRVDLNPGQIENWSWTAASQRDQLKHIEEQLSAVMSERDALQRRINVLNSELQRVRSLLPSANIIPFKTKA